MLFERNGTNPRIDPSAKVAASAQLVGDVTIGARCFVDHGVVIASGGPPLVLGEGVIVFAGSVLRSVGGQSRPAFATRIGDRSVISPLCSLVGCTIGRSCYVATGVIVLQGARVGDRTRLAAGAIVHARTELPDESRVGLRHVAVPTDDGFLSTADVELARELIAGGDFFETAFGTDERDQARLHEEVIERLLAEVHGWEDIQTDVGRH